MPQTQVITFESFALKLLNRGELAEAEPWIEKAIEAATKASARRYLSVDWLMLAVCRYEQGRRAEARQLLSEALELAKQTGLAFIGPSLVGAMAAFAEDPDERKRLLQEGEAMVHAGCLAHASLMFHRDAIDVSLADKNWDEALRYAEALEASCRAEPLTFATLVAERARALVALAREGPRPDVVAELERVGRSLRQARIGSVVPKIEDVLASLPATATPAQISRPSAA